MIIRDIVVEDVLYDTVLSTAFIAYDEVKKEIEEVYLTHFLWLQTRYIILVNTILNWQLQLIT